MKAVAISTCFLFLVGNEIVSMIAVFALLIELLVVIIDERVNKMPWD